MKIARCITHSMVNKLLKGGYPNVITAHVIGDLSHQDPKYQNLFFLKRRSAYNLLCFV